MEIEIVSDIQNALLQRREVKFSVSYDSSTVSKAELKTELCKKLSANPESSIIEKVAQRFGERKSDGVFYVYKDSATLEAMEPKYILKRYGKSSSQKEGQAESAAPQKGAGSEKSEKKEPKAPQHKAASAEGGNAGDKK